MSPCRFRDRPGHVCTRRDGRPIRPGIEECYAEARAQVRDLGALRVAATSIVADVRVHFLLVHRGEWDAA